MLDHLSEARPAGLIGLLGEIGVVAKMKERLMQAIGGRLHQPCALPAWLAAGIAHPASPVPA